MCKGNLRCSGELNFMGERIFKWRKSNVRVVRRELTFSQQGKLGSRLEDEELLWLGARTLKEVSNLGWAHPHKKRIAFYFPILSKHSFYYSDKTYPQNMKSSPQTN